MNERLPDLSVVPPGERSALSIPGDGCVSIEAYPALFRPGQCEPVANVAPTIFNEPLIILRCGLMTLQKHVSLFQNPEESLLSDIQHVLKLAESLKTVSCLGATSTRFAPVLFPVHFEKRPSTPMALVETLDMAAKKIDVTSWSADASYRTFLENGVDVLKADGSWTGSSRHLTSEELANKLEELKALLSYFSDGLTISLGIDQKGATDFYTVPCFSVGWTPSGNLGGLLHGFVD